jgi:lipoprotein-anchoring transpeptidase ErfK/SrfK
MAEHGAGPPPSIGLLLSHGCIRLAGIRMKLSGSTLVPIIAFGLAGVLASAAAEPSERCARRSELNARAASLPGDVARPPEEAKRYPTFGGARMSQPARSSAALPSTVPRPAPMNRAAAKSVVSRPESLAVRAERTNQPRILTPLLRTPSMARKYQARLSTAPAVTVTRTPVPGRSGSVSLNRFVFRRDAPRMVRESADALRVDGPSGPDDLR